MSRELTVEEQVRCVYAALQHLKHNRSTVDIAAELGISRFMVGRMVQRARDAGLVEVRSMLAEPIDAELSRALAARYGLSAAYVVLPAVEQAAPTRSAIAAVCARLLAEMVEEDDIIGLTPGRTTIEMCAHLERLPVCDVVQLTGVATSDVGESLRAVASISSIARGKTYPLHAPMVATDVNAGRTIAEQPAVRQALERMNTLDKAVLTIGGWPDSSLLAGQAALMGDLRRLEGEGVVAEIGSTLLDAEGRSLPGLAGRVIGISDRQLAAVPYKMAIGGGPGKERAVLAVLRAGLADVLVTDALAARYVLNEG